VNLEITKLEKISCKFWNYDSKFWKIRSFHWNFMQIYELL